MDEGGRSYLEEEIICVKVVKYERVGDILRIFGRLIGGKWVYGEWLDVK